LVLGFAAQLGYGWGRENKDRVRLDDVKVLTLKKGEYTAGRRSSPVPQLACVGGSGRHLAKDIDVVQCKNMGSDGYDVQWKCEADLDNSVKFGKIEVSCEGYDYPEDPFILRGSCGLEYTLELTKQGQQQQHQQPQYHHQSDYHDTHHNSYNSHTSGFKFKNLILFGIVVFIFYNVYKQCTQINTYPSGRAPGSGAGYGPGWGPGGGGGGGGPGSGPYYGGGDSCQPPPATYGTGASWRPGFWTGLATGGFLGNMWGRPRTGYYSSTPRYTRAFSSGPSFSSGGGGGMSSGSRSASGFGGTRRR